MDSRQVLTYSGLAAAAVVLLDYFFGLAAPSAVIGAGVTLFTAIFMYVWPFFKVLREKVIGPDQ
jgi:hypothetical protein